MKMISVNCQELHKITTQLEEAKTAFDGLGCGLEAVMVDNELEIYGRAEELLFKSINMLKKCMVSPEKVK